jgi:hypothetical protein
MNMVKRGALLAAAAVSLLAVPAPAQAAPIPFTATSGDNCTYGTARGTLEWRITPGPSPVPPVPNAAAIVGTLTDRPTANDPTVCHDDGLLSIVTFTAYRDNTVVDRESRRADNGTVDYSFGLGGTSTQAVNLVVVQVCRHVSTSTAPRYCGRQVRITHP